VPWHPPGWQSAGLQQAQVGQPVVVSTALARPQLLLHDSVGQLVPASAGRPLHTQVAQPVLLSWMVPPGHDTRHESVGHIALS
jgi:hypothetical protein